MACRQTRCFACTQRDAYPTQLSPKVPLDEFQRAIASSSSSTAMMGSPSNSNDGHDGLSIATSMCFQWFSNQRDAVLYM